MGNRRAMIIANHTAGLDPVVIQASVPFHIRWMMAEDMRLGQLEWLWQWLEVIFVSRTSRDSIGTREAIRHLRQGGVIGIFPEGGLERPPFHLMPFQAGVGLLIKRSGARVLPAIVDGTPQVDPAWASLWRPSRTRVRFKPTLDYSGLDLSPAEIAADLRRRFAEWTGWPFNDEPSQIEQGAAGKSRLRRSVPDPRRRAASSRRSIASSTRRARLSQARCSMSNSWSNPLSGLCTDRAHPGSPRRRG